MHNIFIALSFVIFFVSCGQSDEQNKFIAKRSAMYYLSKGNCSKAKKALDEVGLDKKDAVSISLYASVYGCQASYQELDLIENIDVIVANSTQVLGSLTELPSSQESEADSSNYTNLMNAIDVLLLSVSDNGVPSAQKRLDQFGTLDGQNLNFQALYLIITQLGKFMKFYGNADGGAKGAGTFGNTCFLSYSHVDAANYINSINPGACVTTAGSPGSDALEAPVSAELIKRRLCDGVYLFNNLRDILSNSSLGDSDSFGDLSQVGEVLDEALFGTGGATTIEQAYNSDANYQDSILAVSEIRSRSACQDLDLPALEKWYAIVFEALLL